MNAKATAQTIVRAPQGDVFDAFVSADTMSKFWFTRKDDGLQQGQMCEWRIGDGEDAPVFSVFVKTLDRPDELVILWGDEGSQTTITWTLQAIDEVTTRLSIEETGFAGSEEEIVARALDSTGGFNQVIVALKALLEHGVQINVVADHA